MSEFHTGCGAYCDSDDPCMCCQLGTEVDSLRAGARVAQAAAGKRIAELTAALAERDRRIDAALEPHVVREWPGTKICASCLVPWPCRYVKVLRGESARMSDFTRSPDCMTMTCDHGRPCGRCLAAEVERLTERVRVLEVERDLAHEASYIKTKKLRDTAAVLAERDQRIARALALHARGEKCVERSVNEHSCSGKCSACYGHWPCHTVKALRGESDE